MPYMSIAEYIRLLKEAIARDEESLEVCKQGLKNVLENIEYYEKNIKEQKERLVAFITEHGEQAE